MDFVIKLIVVLVMLMACYVIISLLADINEWDLSKLNPFKKKKQGSIIPGNTFNCRCSLIPFNTEFVVCESCRHLVEKASCKEVDSIKVIPGFWLTDSSVVRRVGDRKVIDTKYYCKTCNAKDKKKKP
jgi:hypothetical protein